MTIKPAALAMIIAFTALAACATPAPPQYGPATSASSAGFSETAIESDRYRVSYHTRSGSAATASDFALLRASELTLQRGFDWFAVTQRSADVSRDGNGNGPRVGIGIGGGNFGSHSGVSIGTGVGFNLGGGQGAGSGATSTIEIRMGHGAKPADANAYDAREVERALRPRT